MSPVLARLDALNRALLAKGWPSLSRWWLDTLTAFVTSRRRQLVARVGRRGGKSSTLCRFAVAFALSYDTSLIPPGDVGIVGFVSVTRDEAAQRLRTIRAILDALGVAYRPVDHGIELVGRPIVFKVFVATIAGVVGGTWILAICDEVASWRDSDTGANPATEVLASLRPTMATQLQGLFVLSSSPRGNEDAHAKAFDLGETEHQIVAYAPTWLANPAVTEEQTRRDEPDARIHAREYEALAQAARLAAFERDPVLFSFRDLPPGSQSYPPFGVVDVSSGKADGYAHGVAAWHQIGPSRSDRVLVFTHLGLIEGPFWSHDAGTRIVAQIASTFRSCGVKHVFGDQRESLMTAAAFSDRGLLFHEAVWTASKKERGVTTVRRWLADQQIIFAPPHTAVHERMRDELLGFEEKVSASGGLTFGARGKQHDDLVACLITVAISDGADRTPGRDGMPGLAGSPNHKPSMRDVAQEFLAFGHRLPDPVPRPKTFREALEYVGSRPDPYAVKNPFKN